uniref:Uncharacterized protein n=1 Tax=Oryza punctata TaxID=4537 RepID=A0A0E0JPS2_ORYPU
MKDDESSSYLHNSIHPAAGGGPNQLRKQSSKPHRRLRKFSHGRIPNSTAGTDSSPCPKLIGWLIVQSEEIPTSGGQQFMLLIWGNTDHFRNSE